MAARVVGIDLGPTNSCVAIAALREGRTAAEEGYDALKKYARDLTAARDGQLDAVIGHDEEIHRVGQVLSRRTKSNPVLIGEPGVGKAAIEPPPRLLRRQPRSEPDPQPGAATAHRRALGPTAASWQAGPRRPR